MSLTADLRDELARIQPVTQQAMAAEVVTIPRFTGGLHFVSGRILAEAELDPPVTARRLRAFLQLLYNAKSTVVVVPGGSPKRSERYVVRVVHKADELTRVTGLVDFLRRPVYRLPMNLVASGREDSTAIWHGAFPARGSLMEPGCSTFLEVIYPGPEVALAMVGCVRRLGAAACSKEVRRTDRVSVRDSEAIGQLIEAMGVREAFKTWQNRREYYEARGDANRLADFGDANPYRSARAAVAIGTGVERAFGILENKASAHLLETGKLCLQYKRAPLEELDEHTDPPLTKGVVTGQIRRLLTMADEVVHERGIPNAETALTLEMLGED